LSKSHHGPKLWASQNIFAGRTTFDFWSNMAISQAKPYVAAPGASLAGKPMGAQPINPSSSAPCAVSMRLSRIDPHIRDEPCAKRRALLGIFSSRYSSRFSKFPISWSIFFFLPLVYTCLRCSRCRIYELLEPVPQVDWKDVCHIENAIVSRRRPPRARLEACCAECGSVTRKRDSLCRKDDATSLGSYLSWQLGVLRNALSVFAFLRYAFGGGCSILWLA
jgi:hypothetical protein